MIEKLKKVFYCGFCGKHYLTKKACARHEFRCNKNPENHRDCFTCYYLCKKEIDIIYDDFYTDDEKPGKFKTFHCSKLKKNLIPPIAVINNSIVPEWQAQIKGKLMPVDCDEFISKKNLDEDFHFYETIKNDILGGNNE